MAIERTWTVARFKSGSWTFGGPADDPCYAEAEVFRVKALTGQKAVRKAQAKRSRDIKKFREAKTTTFHNIWSGKAVEVEVDGEGFIRFGDIAIEVLDQQCQYASRHLDGRCGDVMLADGLRLLGDPKDYHCVRIHRDDAQPFIDRYQAHQTALRRFRLPQSSNHAIPPKEPQGELQ